MIPQQCCPATAARHHLRNDLWQLEHVRLADRSSVLKANVPSLLEFFLDLCEGSGATCELALSLPFSLLMLSYLGECPISFFPPLPLCCCPRAFTVKSRKGSLLGVCGAFILDARIVLACSRPPKLTPSSLAAHKPCVLGHSSQVSSTTPSPTLLLM